MNDPSPGVRERDESPSAVQSLFDDNPSMFQLLFERSADGVRHFYSGEMAGETAAPGQDPRGAPDLMLIWTLLDLTRRGRDPDWYPSLSYSR